MAKKTMSTKVFKAIAKKQTDALVANPTKKEVKEFFTPIVKSKDEFIKVCSTSKTAKEAHAKLSKVKKS